MKKQKFRLKIQSLDTSLFIVDKPIFSLNEFTAGLEASQHVPRWARSLMLKHRLEAIITKEPKK